MQAIYYAPTNAVVQEKDEVTIYSFHDEYSLWFDVHKTNGWDKTLINEVVFYFFCLLAFSEKVVITCTLALAFTEFMPHWQPV